MSMIVYILRGISGSGKSTYAKSLNPHAICSADDFFIGKDGKYNWYAKGIPIAHETCRAKFKAAITVNETNIDDIIVVDNTSIRRDEYEWYVKTAQAYGHEVRIVEFVCPNEDAVQQCISRNTHGTPAAIIERAWKRFAHDERAWKVIEI